MAPGPADSSESTWVTVSVPSPSSTAPVRSARSASRHPGGAATGRDCGDMANCPRLEVNRLLVGERLDHLFGDIDALAGEHDGVLQDEVELLGLGHLLDHLVRPLLHPGKLFVAAKVKVF